MKTRFYILLTLTGICTAILSCRKNAKYYTTHVFWFDKATKDSLVKHGYRLFALELNSSVQNGDGGFKRYDTTYFSADPGCEDPKVMYFKRGLSKKERQSIGYKIVYLEETGTANVYTSHTVRNWEGTMELVQGTCGSTQLTW